MALKLIGDRISRNMQASRFFVIRAHGCMRAHMDCKKLRGASSYRLDSVRPAESDCNRD